MSKGHAVKSLSIHSGMSEAQRHCLSHLLRNAEAALEGVVTLVENSDEQISTADLHGCLRGVTKTLDKILAALEAGTFCALNEEECKFVSRFAGCNGVPIKPSK